MTLCNQYYNTKKKSTVQLAFILSRTSPEEKTNMSRQCEKIRFCSLLLLFVLLNSFLAPAEGHARTIHFTALDGHPLTATLDTPDAGKDHHAGVILLPMYNATRADWKPLTRTLTAAGFTCLALDFRGQGDSRFAADGSDDGARVLQRDPTLFMAMYQDVAAADQWLRNRQPKLTKLGIIGASVGCSVAVHAITSQAVRADAAVLMTPGKNYLGVPTMIHIRQWPDIPLLILSSEEEQERGAVALYQGVKDKGAVLRLFPQTSIHGTNMLDNVPAVEAFITDWLKKILRP